MFRACTCHLYCGIVKSSTTLWERSFDGGNNECMQNFGGEPRGELVFGERKMYLEG